MVQLPIKGDVKMLIINLFPSIVNTMDEVAIHDERRPSQSCPNQTPDIFAVDIKLFW